MIIIAGNQWAERIEISIQQVVALRCLGYELVECERCMRELVLPALVYHVRVFEPHSDIDATYYHVLSVLRSLDSA